MGPSKDGGYSTKLPLSWKVPLVCLLLLLLFPAVDVDDGGDTA